jgi:hypothetical protein
MTALEAQREKESTDESLIDCTPYVRSYITFSPLRRVK